MCTDTLTPDSEYKRQTPDNEVSKASGCRWGVWRLSRLVYEEVTRQPYVSRDEAAAATASHWTSVPTSDSHQSANASSSPRGHPSEFHWPADDSSSSRGQSAAAAAGLMTPTVTPRKLPASASRSFPGVRTVYGGEGGRCGRGVAGSRPTSGVSRARVRAASASRALSAPTADEGELRGIRSGVQRTHSSLAASERVGRSLHLDMKHRPASAMDIRCGSGGGGGGGSLYSGCQLSTTPRLTQQRGVIDPKGSSARSRMDQGDERNTEAWRARAKSAWREQVRSHGKGGEPTQLRTHATWSAQVMEHVAAMATPTMTTTSLYGAYKGTPRTHAADATSRLPPQKMTSMRTAQPVDGGPKP